MSDDHTTQAFGIYGSRLAKLNPTPVLDSLANEGIRFDYVFCNNSICVPSRATILTGQYSSTNGVHDNKASLPPDRQYLAIEMKKAGYETAVIGKWHLKALPGAFDYYAVMNRQGDYFDPEYKIRGEQGGTDKIVRKGQHSSDATTDLSIEWLENKRDKSKPFMLLHHFKAPHDKFLNAPRYDTYLEDIDIPEPNNLFQGPNGSPGAAGFGKSLTGASSRGWLAKQANLPKDLTDQERGSAMYQHLLKQYLRCVKGIDDNVKRLINYLDATGELNNTVIMYTGDQGYFLGEHDLWDKRWVYEESMRMPFIVHWPEGVKRGAVCDWLINNTDFAPTILDIAGLEHPDYMQGRSFANAFSGEPEPADWRKVTYYRYWDHLALRVPAHMAVRSKRYKLIFFYGLPYTDENLEQTPAAWEFYDLVKDPGEMNNLYDNPAYDLVITEMKAELFRVREELNETDEGRPRIQKIIHAHHPVTSSLQNGTSRNFQQENLKK